MATPLLTLPTEDRILLYLSVFDDLEDVFEAPSDVTQKEIALNVSVQRKHISRYLKKLMVEDLIKEHVCHVHGAKQRMRCYSLSWTGRKRSQEIGKYIGEKVVKVRIADKITDMKVSDIDGATSVHLTLSDIVNVAMETDDHLDMEILEKLEDKKRRAVDERTQKAEVYRKALVVVWRDGALTSSEKHLIDALKQHLGVTDEEHDSMEEKIINNLDPIRKVHIGLLEDVEHLLGQNPTNREENILHLIKERFGLE
jgi:DNA-binding MarR family transcriptional regulator